jgi:glutathione S-transferase
MALTIYGSPHSRTMRTLWAAAELGLAHDHVPDWLVGAHFTIADLNVAGVLSPSRARGLDLGRHPHATAWLARCYDRPAARATRQRFGS